MRTYNEVAVILDRRLAPPPKRLFKLARALQIVIVQIRRGSRD